MREIRFRAKGQTEGIWHYGFLTNIYSKVCYIFDNTKPYYRNEFICKYDTLSQYTGLKDKDGKEIYEGDIVRLILENGEIRYFKVSIKKIIREVLCHPDFYDKIAKVELNTVCFEWNGYELLPCIDDNGVVDYSKMKVIGNIYDNSELLEV